MKRKQLGNNKLKDIFEHSSNSANYLKNYSRYILELLDQLDYTALENIIRCFCDARKRSSTIFFVGNGGSAATASHFAQDLAEVGRKTGKRCFRTCGLTNSIPHITALANDYGYETIFTGQMQDFFKKKDVMVAISASGNSPNIVKAVEYAKRLGGETIGLVGFDGGKLSRLCDYVLHVKTRHGEYGPVEDIHMLLNHMITTYLIMKI